MKMYEKLCEKAAEIFKVSAEELLGRSRKKQIAAARHALSWALYENHKNYELVGKIMGRDHTTIMYACKIAKAMMDEDELYRVRCARVLSLVFNERIAEIDSAETIIRKLVEETKAKALTPEFWPEEKSLKMLIAKKAMEQVRGVDPHVVRIQPVQVECFGARWIVRFESMETGKGLGFKFMDMEQVYL